MDWPDRDSRLAVGHRGGFLWVPLLAWILGVGLATGTARADPTEDLLLATRPVARLAWLPNTETDLAGYRLHYGFAPDRLTWTTNVGLVTSMSVELPVGNETYFFALSAFSTANLESGLSEVVSNHYSLPLGVGLTMASLEPARGPKGSILSMPLPAILRVAGEWILVEPPAHGAIRGSPPVFEYVPEVGFVGTDRFRFSLLPVGRNEVIQVDGLVELLPANNPPVAVGSSIVTQMDLPVEIFLSATDPEGASLSYHIVSGPEHGRLVLDFPRVTYHPGTNALGRPFIGTDTFQFTVDDGDLESQPVIVEIVVEPDPERPESLLVAVQTYEDTPVEVVLTPPPFGLPPFDFEVMGDLGGHISARFSSSFTYTPETNRNGLVQFDYRVTDSNDLSSTGRVEILIWAVNDPPVALPGLLLARSGAIVRVPLQGVDADDRELTFQIREHPVHGHLLDQAGDVFYHADDGYIGEDELTYFVSDQYSESVVEACRILVVPSAEISVPPSLETDVSGKTTLRIRWKTIPGVRYAVVMKTNWDDTTWQRLSEPRVADGTEATLVLPMPEGMASAFYAVEMPDFTF